MAVSLMKMKLPDVGMAVSVMKMTFSDISDVM